MKNIETLITNYSHEIKSIDEWQKERQEFFRELRFKLSRPHTTCYSDTDYENMRKDYLKDRSIRFARRELYAQIIEDLKEL